MLLTVKRKRRSAVSTGIERICSHYIEWSLNDKGLNLSEMDVEHITNALTENSLEGKLYTISPNGKIVGGYWNIQW